MEAPPPPASSSARSRRSTAEGDLPPHPPTSSARGVSDTGVLRAAHHHAMHAIAGGATTTRSSRPWTAPSPKPKGGLLASPRTHAAGQHPLRGMTRLTRLSLVSVDYEADDGPGRVEGDAFIPHSADGAPDASPIVCAASFVSAICGFPSLSLPFAVAQLGWGAGVAAVAAVGAATALLATALVVSLVEHPKGVRHATYSALAAAHLGRGAARTVLGLQVVACIGACLSTLLIGGGAVKSLVALALAPFGRAPPHLAACIWAFAAVQATSAALRGRAAVAAAAVGAAAFGGAAVLSVSLSVAAGRAAPPRSYALPAYPAPGDRAVSVLVGLGLIINNLAIGIVPELAAAAAPPVEATMRRATAYAFSLIVPAYLSVAAAGYWAFGADVDVVLLASLGGGAGGSGGGARAHAAALAAAWTAVAVNTYAVFNAYAAPLYDAAWAWGGRAAAARHPRLGRPAARFAGRAALVAACALAASAVPFFGELGALFGAVMALLDYSVPPLCVARTRFGAAARPAAAAAARAWAAATAALAAAIAAASLYSLARSAAELRFFADV